MQELTSSEAAETEAASSAASELPPLQPAAANDGGMEEALGEILAQADTAEARNAFDSYDTDGSGVIDKSELSSLLRSLNLELSSEQLELYLELLLKKLDTMPSSTLTFAEFEPFYHKCLASEKQRQTFAKKALASVERRQIRHHAKEVFDAADKDGSGSLGVEELSSLLRQTLMSVAEQMDDSEWTLMVEDVIARGDKDSSAEFDFPEFVNFYRKCLSNSVLQKSYGNKLLLRHQEKSGKLVLLDAEEEPEE